MLPEPMAALIIGAVIITYFTIKNANNTVLAIFNFLMWSLVCFSGYYGQVVVYDTLTYSFDAVTAYGGLAMTIFSLLLLVISMFYEL